MKGAETLNTALNIQHPTLGRHGDNQTDREVLLYVYTLTHAPFSPLLCLPEVPWRMKISLAMVPILKQSFMPLSLSI